MISCRYYKKTQVAFTKKLYINRVKSTYVNRNVCNAIAQVSQDVPLIDQNAVTTNTTGQEQVFNVSAKDVFKFPMKEAPSVVNEMSYSSFMKRVAENEILSIKVDRVPKSAYVQDIEGNNFIVHLPLSIDIDKLIDKNVEVFIRPDTVNRDIRSIAEGVMTLFGIFFQVGLIGLIIYSLSGRSIMNSSMMSPVKTETNEYDDTMPKTTFKEVAGMEGPKNELIEIVEFLKNPEQFTKMGASLPKGVLLSGPPGTGKTLLARAVAGEAGVPFLYCSGSEFIQVFVGVGASRIRDLFKKAREKAPCIIFIDEIDAIGRERSANLSSGANTEQEQTMNQILTEMDGFKENSGIIVIAATNRKDILDQALTRSGRFDRHVEIPYPSKQERLDILKIYTDAKPIASDVDISELSVLTQGMVGADIKSLVNEAAIYATRNKEDIISKEAFMKSLDKMQLGIENKSIVMTDNEKKTIAYHEAGHALLGLLVKNYDEVIKVTIVPRGDAGGLTIFQGEDRDLQLYSQQYLLNRLIVALGGRVAEELIFGKLYVTTGAVSDLQTVQELTRNMVATFGFNETLGSVSWSDNIGYSSEIASGIDAEVKVIIEWAYDQARKLLIKHESYLHNIANALIEKNTIDREGLLEAVKGLDLSIEYTDIDYHEIVDLKINMEDTDEIIHE